MNPSRPIPQAPRPTGRQARPVLTRQQRLEEIERLRKRVNEHTEFLAGVDALQGASDQAKDVSVAAFHECLLTLERQLGLISEDLRLG